MNNDKKILITGGAGYIGSHTVHYFVNQGIDPKNIVVVDNLIYGHKSYLPKGVVFVKGDLLNKKTVAKIFKEHKIDSVIHFAAYAFVGESMENPGKYFENNIQGGVNLLEAMVANGCKKIVFSSSCAVYGTPKTTPITEDQPNSPINPYGESKLMFEKILEWYWQIYKVNSVRLRYFNAAGAGFEIGESHNPETHLIPLVISAAQKKRKSISIFGNNYSTPDGTCIRDYVHVLDLADAHLKALQYMNKKTGTNFFNIGTGIGTSVKEIVDKVKKYQSKFAVIKEKQRVGDPPILVADPSKANKILKWKSKYNIDDIIKDAWNWHSR
ncbi:MAG TPA: UDP-glucose 4-epimerase GalE [Candidatus Woesebacteria bacterium]|nr:UDP-glucose 4-epimerase GalE [Candidatus Woesebacteria bacterium]